MSDAYLLAGARTPIGSFCGALLPLSAPELGGVAIRAAMARANCGPDQIDEVIMGHVLGAGVGQAPARQAALQAGLPSSIAAVTVNKVCGSGLKAVMMAAQAIRCGDADLIVAGGMESMSNAPHFAAGLRTGVKLGDIQLRDAMVVDGLICPFEGCHMGNHAAYTARKFGISREDQDAFAAESQQRAARAAAEGLFADEIVPVTVKTRKEERLVSCDEGIRADTTLEGLARLKPVFDPQGTVTAGNASTLSDGAAAVLVASHHAAAAADTPWRARIVAAHTSGTDPQDVFIAPVTAIQGALQKAELSSAQIDLYEINEAFAAQMLACVRQLELDPLKVNVHGGAISLGHPLGASGARVLVTLLYALRRREAKRGVASLCLGGGNAVALVVEML